ncbi:MAG TPA: response regulator [Chthoniobacterales bacterium]|nr:response regulator [Chthoniobacterales bacterium]
MGNKILVVEDDNIPIIVISGKPPSEIADRAFRLGASAFLSKPVDRDKLVAAVRDAFGESVSETVPFSEPAERGPFFSFG